MTLTKQRKLRPVTVTAFTHIRMRVRLYLGGLIHTEQKGTVLTRYGILMMKSVHNVLPDHPLNVLMRNFSASDRLILKRMVIGYTERYPFTLISLTGSRAQEMCGVLNILPTTTNAEHSNNGTILMTEGEEGEPPKKTGRNP